MSEKGFILNIVMIVVILTLVFLSQQPYFMNTGKNLYLQGIKQGGIYWSNFDEWFKSNIYPGVSREVTRRGETVKKEIDKQKNNVVQNIWEKFKSYFAAKFSKTFGTKVE